MERNPEIGRRPVILAAFAAILCCVFAGRAEAYPAVDTTRTASLKVTGVYSGQPVSGVSYSLYKVAEFAQKDDTDVSFPLTQAFAAYAESIDFELTFDDMTSDSWAQSAATLAPYVVRDQLKPDAQAQSGEDGTASFASLPEGLYLMTASYSGTEFGSVTMAPCFLTLPELSEDRTAWIYDVSAASKLKTSGVQGEPRSLTVTARKAWSGDQSSERPSSVTVQLLDSSGRAVDEQKLSSDNGWSCSWTDLDAEETYSVVEKKVPSGYKVSVSSSAPSDGTTAYVLKNTKKPSGVQGENRPKETDKPGIAGQTRLPQTGQLWWPVFLLAGAGVALVLLGILRRYSGRKDLKD